MYFYSPLAVVVDDTDGIYINLMKYLVRPLAIFNVFYYLHTIITVII